MHILDCYPEEYLASGHGVWVPYFDVIGHITLDSLAIPKTHVYDKYFPGVNYGTRFGIIFNSRLEINKRGCFEFYLESDDGSILWIGDSLIIDNDKPHKMTAIRDTMAMETGEYTVKVWYYNAFEAQYGLILRSKTLPDSVGCKEEKAIGIKRKLTIDFNNVLFDFDSYGITPAGLKELDTLCDDLNKRDFTRIQILGFTDNVGTVKYNEDLSLKRAESIMLYMKTKVLKPGVIWEAEGRGSSSPLVPGKNMEDLHMNRRVEIYIE
jgi:outer membrane protein OmpA-like peptidoglycan-associated protein